MTLSILQCYGVDENRAVSVILLVVQAGKQASRQAGRQADRQAGRQAGIAKFPYNLTATSRMQDNVPINNNKFSHSMGQNDFTFSFI